MLIPVDVPFHQRVWIDLAVRCSIYAESGEGVSKYLLKHAHVRGTYTDEQVSSRVRRSFVGMLRDEVPRDMAVLEVSEAYGIPQAHVAAVVGDVEIPEDAGPKVTPERPL